MNRIACIVLVALLLTGCVRYGPDPWAKEFVARLKCGMTINEVQKLSPNRFWTVDTRLNADASYMVGRETKVFMSFKDGGLQWLHLGLGTGLENQCSLPEIDLCRRDRDAATGR